MVPRAVRALGEVALRVNRLDEMQAFYSNVVGLELMRRFEHAAFFRIADGYAGHTAVIVPQVRHRVRPEGRVRFFVEFHRRP